VEEKKGKMMTGAVSTKDIKSADKPDKKEEALVGRVSPTANLSNRKFDRNSASGSEAQDERGEAPGGWMAKKLGARRNPGVKVFADETGRGGRFLCLPTPGRVEASKKERGKKSTLMAFSEAS